MMNGMQTAIIKKDYRNVISNKRFFSVLLIVPLVLTVIVPSIFILSIHFASGDTRIWAIFKKCSICSLSTGRRIP